MTRIKNILIATFILVTAQSTFAQVAPSYEIGTWAGFHDCAVSYTFDDGCSGQFSKAIPIFDEIGYNLTMFTVSGWSGANWTKLQSAAKNGHEVANHSTTHANFGSSTVDVQRTEIETSQNVINSKITTGKSVTMATPNCAEGNKALCMQYFIAVRGCSGAIESKTPANFNNVSSVICGSLGPIQKASDFNTKADQAAKSKGWLVYLIHGIDNDGGYSPLSSDTLKSSLQHLKENDSKFWVSTFGNVARYIKERNCTSVSETALSETSITVSVTDTLSDNEVFNFPITIRRKLPEGWSSASVTQNGTAVNDTIVEVNSVKYIQFEAVPDGGSVVISKVSSSNANDLRGSLNNEFNIWINNNELRFSVPAQSDKNTTLSFFDLKGSKVMTFSNYSVTNGIVTLELNSSIPRPANYLVQLSDGKASWSKKVRLM